MSIGPKNGREGGAGALDDLRKCQTDIISLRHKCDRQIDEIERDFRASVRPCMQRRSSLIRSVPRFWSTSILNHPLISTLFEPGESDVLEYLSSLDVDEDPKSPDTFKIRFSFRRNPFFENRTLTKEFTESGSINSPVRWRAGQAFPKVTEHDLWEDDDLGLEYKGFFRWFLDPNEHYCDPMADILRTCIWYNPMEYFDRGPLRPGRETVPESGGGKAPGKVKNRSSAPGNRSREESMLQQ